LADHASKTQSPAQLRNAHRPASGKKAMADYEAEAIATRQKTERLKALRLAKEAAEKIAAPTAGAAAPTKRPAKKDKVPSATLSEWLKDQERGGRRR
jgi:hypothetical protein